MWFSRAPILASGGLFLLAGIENHRSGSVLLWVCVIWLVLVFVGRWGCRAAFENLAGENFVGFGGCDLDLMYHELAE